MKMNLDDNIKKQKLKGNKYIRDPIHDIIKIEDQVILDLIDTKPFQRLRYIKQLPFASYVYPGATHTRFLHSLGVYHLSTRLLDSLEVDDEYDRLLVKVAALLHDIGHGPFSHLFEELLKMAGYTDRVKDHEIWTTKIIKEDKEIERILKQISPKFNEEVRSIISHTHKKKLLMDIVSSQFDADRLDYMLRDSYMTGVKYGNFDLNWLLRTLSRKNREKRDEDNNVIGDEICFAVEKQRGLSCLQEYLLGNYYMYEHVYFHPVVIGLESILILALKKAMKLLKNGRITGFYNNVFKKLSNAESLTIKDYLSLNDSVIISWLHDWRNSDNTELSQLSSELLNRKPYMVFQSKKSWKHDSRVCQIYKENSLNFEFQFREREVSRLALKGDYDYKENLKIPLKIYIYDRKNNDIASFDELSKNNKLNEVAKAISELEFKEYFITTPRTIEKSFKSILEGNQNE
ncbi:MAG: HD domain-containing protein [candidate division Zixibacteria bacterium]|nr:HD domain-containing protein [candidate division Zixibacteria bacterium]